MISTFQPITVAIMANKMQKDVRIVAIGASAGDLEAFENLFKLMPTDTGLAFIVLTHQMPKHVSLLTELIGKYTTMPVYTIPSAITIDKNCIYVLPPDYNAEITGSTLITVKQSQPHHMNMPIDQFFKSMAEARGDKSIGLLLSGSGNDGTQGVRAIKKSGGIVIVQTPDSAKFEGMLQSAIDTHLVDFVLPVNAIIHEIVSIAKNDEISFNANDIEIRQIYKLLESHTGHDFSNYKINTINRRIERQMQRNHSINIEDYIKLLSQKTELIDNLFEDLLIGVTSFFRDNTAFEALKTVLIHKLSINKIEESTIRVWIPGCATGEEAYTMAILILESLAVLKLNLRIQIFATDIDNKALDVARAGVYHQSEVANISSERLNSFFIRENNHYRIRREVRDLINFGFQNVILDPPFTKLDIISCRNLLIYFNSDLQKKLFRVFHYSLKSKGILFLGSSEAVTGYNNLFKLMMREWKIYERNDAASNSALLMNYPSVKRSTDHRIPLSFKMPAEDKSDLGNFVAKHFLSTFISAAALINIEGKILYHQGNISTFIKDLTPEDQNLFEHISSQLKNKIISGIKKSLENQIEIGLFNLKTKMGTDKVIFNIIILPITELESDKPLVCIFFQNIITKEQIDFVLEKYGTEMEISKKIIAVQQELEFTKETLQATVEELQSNNEELQSTNEELQSTIEEVETSKEEFLSLNEELIIVNSELQNRIDLSTAVTEDLNNLFYSTQIIAVFLDTNLCIKLFTPRLNEIMNLRPHDIGRAWNHFATNLKYNEFDSNFAEVIGDNTDKQFEVETFDGRWFEVMIRPYKTLLNIIDGVVMTFTEITEHKKVLAELSKTNDVLQKSLTNIENIFNSLKEPMLVLSDKLIIARANDYFYELIGETSEALHGKSVFDIMAKSYKLDNLTAEIKELIDKSHITLDKILTFEIPGTGIITVNLIGHQLVECSEEAMIILIFRTLDD